jgi:hypothetical protein
MSGISPPLFPAILTTLFVFSLPLIYLIATDRTTSSPAPHEADMERDDDDR